MKLRNGKVLALLLLFGISGAFAAVPRHVPLASLSFHYIEKPGVRLGKIVLALGEGAKYAVMMQEAGECGTALAGVEALVFGFGHPEVGGRLLAKWGLPEEISVPVLNHHKVCWVPPFERICAVISLGNIMAHDIDDGIPGKQNDSQEAIGAMRVLQLEEADLAALAEEAKADIARMAGSLGAAA